MAMIELGPGPLVRAPTKTITFDGSSGLGLVNTNTTIWTITGRVAMTYLGCYVDTTVAGGVNASLQMGVTGNTAAMKAVTQITAIPLTATYIWDSNGARGYDALNTVSLSTPYALLSADVILRTTVATITSGVLVFDCYYLPLTDGGGLA